MGVLLKESELISQKTMLTETKRATSAAAPVSPVADVPTKYQLREHALTNEKPLRWSGSHRPQRRSEKAKFLLTGQTRKVQKAQAVVRKKIVDELIKTEKS